MKIWGFPKIKGLFLWGPHNMEYSVLAVLGSILGSPYFVKLPYRALNISPTITGGGGCTQGPGSESGDPCFGALNPKPKTLIQDCDRKFQVSLRGFWILLDMGVGDHGRN